MYFKKILPLLFFFFKSLFYFLLEKEKIRLVKTQRLKSSTLAAWVCARSQDCRETRVLQTWRKPVYLCRDSREVHAKGTQLWVSAWCWRWPLRRWWTDAGVGCPRGCCLLTPTFGLGLVLAASWMLTFRCQLRAQRCLAVNRKLCVIFKHSLALTCMSVK